MNPIVDATEGFFKAVIKPVLDKFVPDAEQRIAASQFAMTQLQTLNLAQIQLNTVEAASPNVFVSGWRPFIGWGCGIGFIYCAVVEPIARFIAQVFFHYAGEFPVIDTSLTLQVMCALLGMASFGLTIS